MSEEQANEKVRDALGLDIYDLPEDAMAAFDERPDKADKIIQDLKNGKYDDNDFHIKDYL